MQKVEGMGIGSRKINYRMRDAIFGRQRYWGEPFPVYYENGIPKLVDVNDLPVTLPEINEYKPTETGEPPLGRAKDWKYKKVDSRQSTVDSGLPYELTTMPGWAGSSWYWFRYMDPKNDKEFVSKEAESYWKDVDLYIGGSEHATGHLLYSRFWCKALKDLGYGHAEEPFKKLINQGHIQGRSNLMHRLIIRRYVSEGTNVFTESEQSIFISYDLVQQYNSKQLSKNDLVQRLKNKSLNEQALKLQNDDFGFGFSALNVPIEFVHDDYLDLEKSNWNSENKTVMRFINNDEGKFLCSWEIEKMSKSKRNVVNPDDIVSNYGADTLRMYEMFLGPLEQSKPWNTNGIDGVFKFLRRFWNLFHDGNGNFHVSDAEPTREELKVLHKTLKKVEQDIENFSFNTSVSEFMICANELSAMKCNKRAILEPLVIALSPFAPHIAEDLWSLLGHPKTILEATFPKYDEQYLKESSFKYPISINGKVRAEMNFALDMPKEDIEKLVLASEIVIKWTEGKTPKKVIVVPGRIVNVVL